jgi:hypothetical protein
LSPIHTDRRLGSGRSPIVPGTRQPLGVSALDAPARSGSFASLTAYDPFPDADANSVKITLHQAKLPTSQYNRRTHMSSKSNHPDIFSSFEQATEVRRSPRRAIATEGGEVNDRQR